MYRCGAQIQEFAPHTDTFLFENVNLELGASGAEMVWRLHDVRPKVYAAPHVDGAQRKQVNTTLIDRAALCEASQERSRVKQKAQKVQKVTKKNYVKKILHEDKKKSCGSL